MTDKHVDNSTEEAQNEQPADSPTSTGRNRTDTVDELVQANLNTFVKLAESDLPIAEDAEKAIALADGGADH